jgi:hypothetical protein
MLLHKFDGNPFKELTRFYPYTLNNLV